MPKLLYILPDLAYVAELLPTKKPFSYAIHNFRQINGEFLDDNEFIEANIAKLLDRLDVADYIVVLPDYLFTDTIVNVRADSEVKVKEYLKSQLLPGLEIDKTSHQIETFILTEFKGIYKVQLSALERSLMAPLARAMAQRGLTTQSIVSLSWSAKSIISLEPSISVLQMGDKLYLSQHYIGIDQTSYAPVLESTNIVETIKTLKGAEPSIQTIYVLASEVVAAQLKDELHDLVPVQQLAVFNETDTKMPSYVKQIIESGMRSLTAPDYMLPKFEMDKAAPVEIHTEIPATEAVAITTEELEFARGLRSQEMTVPDASKIELPKPQEQKTAVELAPTSQVTESIDSIMTDTKTASNSTIDTVVSEVTEAAKITPEAEEAMVAADLEKLFGTANTNTTPAAVVETSSPTVTFKDSAVLPDVAGDTDSVEKFLKDESTKTTASTVDSKDSVQIVAEAKPAAPRQVIKNQTDEKNMVKLVFIGLASFFATVGIGIGLGLGIMMVSNKKPASQTTVIEPAVPSVSPSPVVTTAPIASASAKTATGSAKTAVKNPEKILVVNATKIAGYAGKTATKIQAAGYATVKTGNAAGTYEKGSYILVHETNDALVASISKAAGLTLKSQKGIETEDPKKAYDAVVVLAE